jgi:hypothetical protein
VGSERVIDSSLAPNIERQNEVERVLPKRELVNAGKHELRLNSAGSRQAQRVFAWLDSRQNGPGKILAQSGQSSTRAAPGVEDGKIRRGWLD